MARTIAVADDVYQLLKDSKMPDESFSDVIRRRLRRPPLSELAGKKTLTTEEWERAKRKMEIAEQKTARRLARLQR